MGCETSSPSVFRYEEPYFLDACLALSHIALFSSYWISSYVWFKVGLSTNGIENCIPMLKACLSHVAASRAASYCEAV